MQNPSRLSISNTTSLNVQEKKSYDIYVRVYKGVIPIIAATNASVIKSTGHSSHPISRTDPFLKYEGWRRCGKTRHTERWRLQEDPRRMTTLLHFLHVAAARGMDPSASSSRDRKETAPKRDSCTKYIVFKGKDSPDDTIFLAAEDNVG